MIASFTETLRGSPPAPCTPSRLCNATAIALVIAAHAGMVACGAFWYTATRDEPAHLVAGLSYWQFGDFSLYHVNPPVARLVAALPVWLTGTPIDWSAYDGRPDWRPEFRVGRGLAAKHGAPAQRLIVMGRIACLPFTVIAACVCYLWSSKLYGWCAGWVSLLLWCSCPLVLGNAALITPDVAAAALGPAACYLFWRWLRQPGWAAAVFAGLALGAAELTKFTWIVLVAVWPLLWLMSVCSRGGRQSAPSTKCATKRLGGRRRIWRRASKLGQLVFILALAIYTINVGYGFDGTGGALGEFRFISRAFRGGTTYHEDVDARAPNRFAGTWLRQVPVPLPKDYVLGMDTQKRDFQSGSRTFFRGEWRDSAPWYSYFYALGVKLPLGTLAMIGVACALTLASRKYHERPFDELVLLAPAAAIMAVACFNTSQCTHVRYMLPLLPLVFIWTSKIAMRQPCHYSFVPLVATAALVWSTASSMWYWRHSLSYFNEIAGGPIGGASCLTNSNIDSGQDLYLLKEWLEHRPESRPLHLAYFGGFEPRDLGIDYQPITLREQAGGERRPPPGWYAIGATALWDGQEAHTWFRRMRPVAMAGYSIYIYHVE